MQWVDGGSGLGVWVWTPSRSCRKKDLRVSITRNRRTARVWLGDSPGSVVRDPEVRSSRGGDASRTVPTGRKAVGTTCRDGGPAVPLPWPGLTQRSRSSSGGAPSPRRWSHATRPPGFASCVPAAGLSQPTGSAVGSAVGSAAPEQRPSERLGVCHTRPRTALHRRHVRPQRRAACASGFQAPADVTSAGPGRALWACARPRGLPARLAGSWSRAALALCAEVTPATHSPGP